MASVNLKGMFVPSNNNWEISQIQSVDINSPEFKDLLVRLYQNIGLISTVLNAKDSAYYGLGEFTNGQLYFPNPALNSTTAQSPDYRQVIRVVVNFGALPDTATKTIAHGITCTNTTSFTRIYGTASKMTAAYRYIPLPFASETAGDTIELYVDGTNVNIKTTKDYSAYTNTYVVVEYLKF